MKRRRKMRKVICLLMTAILVFSMAACGGKDAGADTTGDDTGKMQIKVATGGQDTLPSYAATLDVIGDLEAANNNLDFEYFGSRQLGDDAEILQQVMAGTIQIGGGAGTIFSSYTNLLDPFYIPFLLNDYNKERQALTSAEAQAIYDKIEADLGIKILAAYDSGMRHIANNSRPVESIGDLKGLKMRVVPTDVLIKSFSALGASPTTMAYGEVYTGLQNKVIDGEEINITSIYSEKHYEVLKYFTEIGLYPFATTVYANAAWFNSLDEATQKEIEDAFIKGYDYNFDKYLAEAETAGYDAMEKAGVQITKIDDVTPFKEVVAPIMEEYKAKDPLIADFIDMANGL